MHVDEIQSQLSELLVELDELGPKWAEARAAKEKSEELKSVTLAVVTAAAEGDSEAERTRNAKKSTKYLEYLTFSESSALAFYTLEARKKYIEIKIDVLRSFLSFNKFMQEKTL